jgi:hypothetical protein
VLPPTDVGSEVFLSLQYPALSASLFVTCANVFLYCSFGVHKFRTNTVELGTHLQVPVPNKRCIQGRLCRMTHVGVYVTHMAIRCKIGSDDLVSLFH